MGTKAQIWSFGFGDQVTFLDQASSHQCYVSQTSSRDCGTISGLQDVERERIDQYQRSDRTGSPTKIQPKLPTGNDGSPLFFRKNTTPDDSCWEFLFWEMRARLWTWWHECDSDNDTQKSPATILIFFVMQWLKHSGKCHIFGFESVPFAGHTQVYSFGRGLHIFGREGNLIRDIIKLLDSQYFEAIHSNSNLADGAPVSTREELSVSI